MIGSRLNKHRALVKQRATRTGLGRGVHGPGLDLKFGLN